MVRTYIHSLHSMFVTEGAVHMNHSLYTIRVLEVDGHDTAEQAALNAQLVTGSGLVVGVQDLGRNPM